MITIFSVQEKLRVSPERVEVGLEGKQSQVGTAAERNREWGMGILPT